MLDLTSLKQAVDALNRSLDIPASELEVLDPKIVEAVRAGVIQQFEVAYELCWKFIQRWVRTNDAEASGQSRTRKELLRSAARLGFRIRRRGSSSVMPETSLRIHTTIFKPN